MTTLDELIYYCKEPEPVGALMLVGEWGCGKTYLIDHVLKEALESSHVVIRISLFGIASIEAIHHMVREAWLDAYLKDKGWDEKGNTVKKLKDKMAKLPLPDGWKNIVSLNPADFLSVDCKINEKDVVLVFDDLERSKMDKIDVLGCINDYCENQNFHTIVVAYEDKLQKNSKSVKEQLKEQLKDYKKDNSTKTSSGFGNQLVEIMPVFIDADSCNHDENISYGEIKEKIIQRTIWYIPDYAGIVKTIIENMKNFPADYYEFLKKYESDILTLFESKVIYQNADGNSIEVGDKQPHNIRSLKCALNDFYRVYKILVENGFSDLQKWLYSFIAYMLAFKAGLVQEGNYGKIFAGEAVKRIYPVYFNSKYIFSAVEDWILHGDWNLDFLLDEVREIKERERAKKPEDIVRTNGILDIEEDIIAQGFPDVLKSAYEGKLTLNEYVIFIVNCRFAREYNYEFSAEVEWDKVLDGIKMAIAEMIIEKEEKSHYRQEISSNNRESYLEQEWEAYKMIKAFWDENVLEYSNNKHLYIESMKKYPSESFTICQNKMFDVFDEEMAAVTAEAFIKIDNGEKCRFGGYFEGMWQSLKSWQNFKIQDTIKGYKKLSELLTVIKESYEKDRKNIAAGHTKTFLSIVEDMIRDLEQSDQPELSTQKENPA